jgi:hypothetical protein
MRWQDEIERTRKEEEMSYFRILFQLWLGVAEERHENPQL